ncbi:MAG: ERCC4 domain-containing protein [Ruthenibacterium sp.]
MHAVDVAESLSSMVILVDTREQDTPRFRLRMQKIGVPYDRKKLDFGDYSAKFRLPCGDWFDLSAHVSVERKMNLDELCQCYTKGRARFEREFARAAYAGAKVYLMVEDGNWEKALSGDYRSHMAPKSLVASMTAWLARYNCQLLFCAPETSGILLKELLFREGKERLCSL